jgi:hypothetical protein
MIEIRVDKRELQRLEKTLAGIPRALPRIMQAALTRTATQARTEASRSLAKQTKLKISTVKDQIALLKASYTNWNSGIQISRRRIRLIDLKARQTRRGVTYASPAGRQLVASAFIARMPTGHIGVFKRRGPARLPIVELRGASLAQVWLAADAEARRIFTESQAKLAKNVQGQVERILKRRAG